MRLWSGVAVAGGACVMAFSACDDSECTPGQQTSCACPNAPSGIQVCADDGSYGGCVCELGGEGGSGAAGGATSSSATTGGGGEGGTPCELDLCGGECVDTQTSNDHCGECDNACPSDTSCVAGECTCDAGNEILCDDVCVYPVNDEDNCGGCGHVCPTGSCQSGFCPIDVIANGEAQPFGLALNATHVYWTSAGATPKVRRSDLDGSNKTDFAVQGADDVADPREIVLDGTNAYWADHGVSADAHVSFQALATGATTSTADEADGVRAVALQGGFLYWTNELAGAIRRADTTDLTPVQDLATGQASPFDLATNATDVYWTNYDNGEIRRVALGGGTSEAIATSQNNPTGIALDDDYVYWANETGGEIHRLALAGGDVEVIAAGQAGPTHIALDDTNIYWTNDDNGTVARAPLAGGAVIVLAAGQNKPHAIAVNDTHVYWTTLNGATVARVAK